MNLWTVSIGCRKIYFVLLSLKKKGDFAKSFLALLLLSPFFTPKKKFFTYYKQRKPNDILMTETLNHRKSTEPSWN